MLSADEYRTVMRVVEKAILSTDMAMYFKKKHKFIELSDNGEFDWQCQEKKERKSVCSIYFPICRDHTTSLIVCSTQGRMYLIAAAMLCDD